jgi:exopolysaccharide biosynthesis polyprenyl glycosylphosphotransferase
MRSHCFIVRVLILGTGTLVRELVKEIGTRPRFGYAVVGIVGDGPPPGGVSFRCPFYESFDDVRQAVQEVRPDRIIVTPADWRRLPVRKLMELRMRGIKMEDGAEVYERLTGKLAIESLTPDRLLFSRTFRPSRFQRLWRRLSSLTLASLGLVLTGPLMLIVAVAIKLDSKGPVCFIQERVGRGGRPFRMIKFRTMHPAVGKTSEWAGDNGDRITSVGKWLRKFRLDELPQFVNILRGDMDLIGPRPHPVTNHDLFVTVLRNTPECGEAIPYYALRCLVRPGITGWAQVRYGYANSLEEEIEKARYDLYYVKHLSLWLDLRILIETAMITLWGGGSAASDVLRTKASMELRTQ